MVLAQYYNFVRFGHDGYRYIMETMKYNARTLAKEIAAIGEFELIGGEQDEQLPLVAFKLAGEHDYDEFDVAAQLAAERGWMVPAYTLPPNAEHVKIMRALVKETLGHSLATTLGDDIAAGVRDARAKGGLHESTASARGQHGLLTAMAQGGDWGRLFGAAFTQSRNAMVLLDGARRQVDANGAYLKLLGYRRADVVGRPIYEFVVGGPIATPAEWEALVRSGQFTGDARMRTADGGAAAVQWAATVEVVTGQQPRAVRGAQHLALGATLSARNQRRWRDGGAVGPRARDRTSRGARQQRPGDRRGAADRARHRPYPRAQRDDEGGRALARPPRGEGDRRRPRARSRVSPARRSGDACAGDGASARALALADHPPRARRGRAAQALPAGRPAPHKAGLSAPRDSRRAR